MCSVLRRDGLSVTISPALEKILSDGTGSRGMSNGRPNLGVLRNPGPDSISNLYINKLWNIQSPIILDDWNYSMNTNNLPLSHKTSLLRLIPKNDKHITLKKIGDQ